MKISLILPTFNNPECLFKGLTYLDENHFFLDNIEVIVVNDGSRDIHSAQYLNISSKFPIIYKLLPTNIGKGGAIKYGVSIAKGDFIIFTDADIPYDFNCLQSIIEHLQTNQYDCVIGNRQHSNDYYTKISMQRGIASKMFNILSNLILGLGKYDNQCGLKGFKRESIMLLFQNSLINRYSFDAEILYRAIYLNYQIKQIDVHLRTFGISSISLITSGVKMLIDLFLIRLFSLNELKKVYKR